eukprot:g5858.t1
MPKRGSTPSSLGLSVPGQRMGDLSDLPVDSLLHVLGILGAMGSDVGTVSSTCRIGRALRSRVRRTYAEALQAYRKDKGIDRLPKVACDNNATLMTAGDRTWSCGLGYSHPDYVPPTPQDRRGSMDPFPREIASLTGLKVVQVAASHSCAMCLTAGGSVLEWGAVEQFRQQHGAKYGAPSRTYTPPRKCRAEPKVVAAAAKEGKVLQAVHYYGSYALVYASGKVATGGANGDFFETIFDDEGDEVFLDEPRWYPDNKLGLGPGVRVASVPVLLADPVRAALE